MDLTPKMRQVISNGGYRICESCGGTGTNLNHQITTVHLSHAERLGLVGSCPQCFGDGIVSEGGILT